MQVYYYEPNREICEVTSRDMEASGLYPQAIESEFFSRDLSILGRDGDSTKGIIISHDEHTLRYINAIRSAGCMNPIMVIVDLKNSIIAAQLINEGADDVMVRPFKGIEVHARLNSINRRTHGIVSKHLQIGEIIAYFDGRDPEVNGERMKLSKREHAIFSHLALNHGRVISKDNLFNAVYAMSDSQPYDKVIDVYICKLRQKIKEKTKHGIYIETVYGRGYKLAAPPESDQKALPKPADAKMIAHQVASGQQSAKFVGEMAERN
jgi:two-component system, cell cycle response regulator CtrA